MKSVYEHQQRYHLSAMVIDRGTRLVKIRSKGTVTLNTLLATCISTLGDILIARLLQLDLCKTS
jgi:uncharacterized protein (DUF488 family)